MHTQQYRFFVFALAEPTWRHHMHALKQFTPMKAFSLLEPCFSFQPAVTRALFLWALLRCALTSCAVLCAVCCALCLLCAVCCVMTSCTVFAVCCVLCAVCSEPARFPLHHQPSHRRGWCCDVPRQHIRAWVEEAARLCALPHKLCDKRAYGADLAYAMR
jgi:hypothetical protein